MKASILRLLAAPASACLAACASLDPVPPNLDFGEAFVGYPTNAKSVAWKNNDGGFWDNMETVRVGGSAFELVSKPPPVNVPLGATTPPAWIRFAPKAEGAFAERAIPYAENEIPGIDARLTGVGVRPVLPEGGYIGPVSTLDPILGTRSSMDFGDIVTGTTAYRTLTLRNTGSVARTLDISFGLGVMYAAASTATASSAIKQVTVAANSSIVIILQFTPFMAGTFPDEVRFRGPGSGGILHIELRLTGKAHPG